MRVNGFEFRPRWPSAVVVLAMLVLLCALGRWQWGRAAEKQALAQQFEAGARDAVLLVHELSDLERLHHRRVQVDGRYLGARQFLLDNRTHEGVAGYHVLTPLVLGDEAAAVLVNRGWVPVGERRDRLPELSVTTEPVRIQGTVAPPPRVVLLGAAGHDEGGWPKVVQSVDFPSMEAAVGVRLLRGQILLDAGAPDGYTRVWAPFYGITPERHRAYAVQWFGLAATLLVLYLFAATRRVAGGDTA